MKTGNKELRPLLLVVGLIVVALIVGFLTIKKSSLPYKVNEKEILQEVIANKYCISTVAAADIVKSGEKKYLFIDLREPGEFIKNHIENAMNIPFEDLLSEDYLEVWKSSEFDKILYSNNEIEATEAWMLLKQLGYTNNMIIAGNYFQDKKDTISIKESFNDPALYNYAEIIKANQTATEVKAAEPKQAIVPKPSPKPVKVEERKASGGC